MILDSDKLKADWKLLRGSDGLLYKLLPGGEFMLYGTLANLKSSTDFGQRLKKTLQQELDFWQQKKQPRSSAARKDLSGEQLALSFESEEQRLFRRLAGIKCMGQSAHRDSAGEGGHPAGKKSRQRVS